jgi:hypothetical protein
MKCSHPPNRAVHAAQVRRTVTARTGHLGGLSVVAYTAAGRDAGRPIEWYSKPKLPISAGS